MKAVSESMHKTVCRDQNNMAYALVGALIGFIVLTPFGILAGGYCGACFGLNLALDLGILFLFALIGTTFGAFAGCFFASTRKK